MTSEHFAEAIIANGSNEFTVVVPASKYVNLLTKSGDLKVSLLGGSDDAEQTSFVSQVIVDVKRPAIDIKVITTLPFFFDIFKHFFHKIPSGEGLKKKFILFCCTF